MHGWKNELQVGWLSSKTKANGHLEGADTIGNSQTYLYFSNSTGDGKAHHFFIRDRISYTLHAGAWNVEPSFNVSYEHNTFNNSQGTGGGIGRGPGTGTNSASLSWHGHKAEQYILTPSLAIYYKDAFLVQGGILSNVSSYTVNGVKRNYPYASLSVDLIRLYRPTSSSVNSSSLKIFGSYARTASFSENDYSLTNLSPGPVFPSLKELPYQFQPVDMNGNPIPFNAPKIPSFYNGRIGAAFSLGKNRLQINYNYEKRNYLLIFGVPDPFNGGTWATFLGEIKSSTHYLGITARLVENKGISWQSRLNFAVIKSKSPLILTNYRYTSPVGDINADHPSWTAGWVNQLQVGDFSAGINLVVHFKERRLISPYPITYGPVNSILVQNIFAGYLLHLSKNRALEIYLNSRNLFQNDKSTLTDRRRYVGLGGKLRI